MNDARRASSTVFALAVALAACEVGGSGPGVTDGAGDEATADDASGSEDDGAPTSSATAAHDETGDPSSRGDSDDSDGGDDDGPAPTGPSGCDEVGPDDAIPAAVRTIDVTSSEELAAALAAAEPGDHIVLADGEYAIEGVAKSGTVDAPIVIRAANPLGATLSDGQLELDAVAFVVVTGMRFTMPATIKVTSSNHVRLTRNVFRLAEAESLKWVIVQGADSHDNRIDHNLFEEKHQLGNFITLDGSETEQTQDDRIDHNHFRNIGPRAENEMEAVRIGWSEISESSGRTVLECNLFEACDGDPEIVSVKSCENTIRDNTFLASQGALVLRHGNGSRVEGNIFLGTGRDGTGGIRIYGQDHVVVNNHLEGLTGVGYDATIQIDGGDVDTSGALSSHFRVYRALVAFNTLVANATGVEFGGHYELAPVDVVVANNIVTGTTGSLFAPVMTPENLVLEGNIVHPTGAAIAGMEASESELWIVDPMLAPAEGLSRPQAGSAAIDAARGEYPQVTADLDGDARTDPKDVGADEVGGVVRRALTPADVGPDAP